MPGLLLDAGIYAHRGDTADIAFCTGREHGKHHTFGRL